MLVCTVCAGVAAFWRCCIAIGDLEVFSSRLEKHNSHYLIWNTTYCGELCGAQGTKRNVEQSCSYSCLSRLNLNSGSRCSAKIPLLPLCSRRNYFLSQRKPKEISPSPFFLFFSASPSFLQIGGVPGIQSSSGDVELCKNGTVKCCCCCSHGIGFQCH